MHRATLGDLVPVSVPTGMVLDSANASDAEQLASLLAPGFPDTGWTVELVFDELLEHPLVTTTHVIRAGDRIVATASSKAIPDAPSTAYLHYVAADPALRGQGLGRAISLAVLHEFAAMGKTNAILDTDDFRLPALATYFALGFEPLIVEDGQDER